jgi:hypothetical protein
MTPNTKKNPYNLERHGSTAKSAKRGSEDITVETRDDTVKKFKKEKKKYYKYKYKYLKAIGQKYNTFLNIIDILEKYKNKLLNIDDNTKNISEHDLQKYTNKYHKYKQKYLNFTKTILN